MGTYVAERPISSNNGDSFYAVSSVTHYTILPSVAMEREDLRK